MISMKEEELKEVEDLELCRYLLNFIPAAEGSAL